MADMEGEFPYLKITDKLRHIIGSRDEDLRVFRQEGKAVDFLIWVRDLNDSVKGGVVPSSWAPVIVGVSRTAFHKRVKSGRLTVFVFEHREYEFNLVMNLVPRKKGEYSYCVFSECEAWRDEIQTREARRHPPEHN